MNPPSGQTNIGYPNLGRPTSRWRTRATAAGIKNVDKVGNRFNVLLYLKNIEADVFEDDPDEPAKKRVKTDKGPQVTKNICEELCAAFKVSQKIGCDKEIAGSGKARRVSKIDILGNREARHLIAEMDELARLARTVYTNPLDLEDWIEKMFEARYRTFMLRRDVTKQAMLQRSLDWGQNWAEVRYRFMNHYMRDDPKLWRRMNLPANRAAGDNANAITHEAHIQEDCFIAESVRFSNEDRELFEFTYGLTVDRAVVLNDLAVSNALQRPVRDVFQWCINVINRFVDWRVDVLRRSARSVRDESSFRWMGTTAQETVIDNQFQKIGRDFKQIDSAYAAFTKAVRLLCTNVSKTSKMSASLFQGLHNAGRDLTVAIHGFPFTNYQFFGARYAAPLRRWPNRDGAPRIPPVPARPTVMAF